MYVSRRPRKSQETRDRIIGAVRDLLAEGAFHESTVDEVASRAGVSRATLYQHFGTRLGLVDAMCEAFDENPALIALREADGLDDFVARVVEFWAAEIKPGTVIMEIGGIAEEKARSAFKRVAHKLPIKVKMIRRLGRSGSIDGTAESSASV